jgi:hypothetical protein
VSEAGSRLGRVSDYPQSAVPDDEPDGARDGDRSGALQVLAEEADVVYAQPVTGALSGDWRTAGAVLPAVQAAAVAAGGFVAGAAVVGLVHRRQRRSGALAKGRGTRRSSRASELVQVVGSRSFLVDVHLLGGPGGNR